MIFKLSTNDFFHSYYRGRIFARASENLSYEMRLSLVEIFPSSKDFQPFPMEGVTPSSGNGENGIENLWAIVLLG